MHQGLHHMPRAQEQRQAEVIHMLKEATQKLPDNTLTLKECLLKPMPIALMLKEAIQGRTGPTATQNDKAAPLLLTIRIILLGQTERHRIVKVIIRTRSE